jgi:shikimate dehydrogenase
VAYVLKRLGIRFQFVSRNPKSKNEIAYSSLLTAHCPLLINATPLGTFPRVEEMPPVPLEVFKPDMLVYDLIYNPAETLLLREAKTRGCALKNGLEMLELQAEAAWEIWRKNR